MILPAPDSVNNILVVNQKNHIGDTICSLPMYEAIKNKFTHAKITLIAAVQYYPFPLEELNPYLDEILYYDKSSSTSIFRFYKTLRQKKYQIGIVPSAIKQSRTAHIINYFSGAAFRVGVNSIDNQLNPMRYLLNIKGDFAWTVNKVHQTDRFLDIIKLIGCDPSYDIKDAGKISLTSQEIADANRFLQAAFPVRSSYIIGVHPGAGKKQCIWQTDNFLSVIKKIYQEFNAQFLIDYGPVDEEIITKIQLELTHEGIPHTLLMNPLKLIVGVLSLVDLYITNDTGPMHIAGNIGTNTIALFGPTKAYEWAPRGDHIDIIESPTDNINDISVDQVFEKCCFVLQKGKNNDR